MMPEGDSLRAARLRRLHARFLDASEQVPWLYVVGISLRNKDPNTKRSPFYLSDNSNHLISGLNLNDLLNASHIVNDELRNETFGYHYSLSHFTFHSLLFDAKFFCVDGSPEVYPKANEAHFDGALDCLRTLSDDAFHEARDQFGSHPLELVDRRGRPGGYHPTWLDYMFLALSQDVFTERWDFKHDGKSVECTICFLPMKVFVACAKAIEILAECKSPNGSAPIADSPKLTDSEAAVMAALQDSGKPLTGKELSKATGVSHGTLTRHILPQLKERGAIANRRGAGYFLSGE